MAVQMRTALLQNFGDSLTQTYTVTRENVSTYAEISGDHNPIHVNPESPEALANGGCIAHGELLRSRISGMLTQGFGPGTLYLGIKANFKKMVFVGSTVTIIVTVVKVREDKPIITLSANVYLEDGTLAIEGESAVWLSKSEKQAELAA